MKQQQYKHLPHECFLSLPQSFGTLRTHLVHIVQQEGLTPSFVTKGAGSLLEKVEEKLSRCSYLIGDLSSPTDGPPGPRPAVMWEIGYAHRAKMGIHLICRARDRDNVPALLKGYFISYYDADDLDPMLNDVSASLHELTLHRHHRDADPRGKDVFHSRVFINRAVADLPAKFETANGTIRILELNLETVAEDYYEHIVGALQRSTDLNVQICTLNPFVEFADARAEQLASMAAKYRRQLCRAIVKIHRELSGVPSERWALKLYNTFPTQIMFQVDHAYIHSIIALGKQSRDLLHFEVTSSDPNAKESFEAHFAQLWATSQSYDEWTAQSLERLRKLDPSLVADAGDDSQSAEPARLPPRKAQASKSKGRGKAA